DIKGRTTVWPPLVDDGRWVKWRGSNLRANQHKYVFADAKSFSLIVIFRFLNNSRNVVYRE
ncbi:hypothetical protein, partial [Herbaspirillum sp. 1173]|uniref:hypothetical protein n=1 Tax=Herbaspirillum sp. 1173 TaxID=2817734 RepID=UPI00286A5C25